MKQSSILVNYITNSYNVHLEQMCPNYILKIDGRFHRHVVITRRSYLINRLIFTIIFLVIKLQRSKNFNV